MLPVSIVIPTYNRAGIIRDAVNSVLRQSYSDFELIVVDDCSKDDTLAVLETVKDPRLKVVRHEKNGGASAARNTGVRAAQGTWIAFQDSDDEWLPTKLERQMARLTEPGTRHVASYTAMIILGTPRDEGARKRTQVRYFPGDDFSPLDGDIYETQLKTNLVSTQTLVVRRDLMNELGGFDLSATPLEDWDCAIRIASRGTIAFVDEPLVIQRFSPDSITRGRLNHVRARELIVEKNRAELAKRPAVLASQHHSIAGVWRELGDYGSARRHMRSAIALRPTQLRFHANYLYTAALSMLQKAGLGAAPNSSGRPTK